MPRALVVAALCLLGCTAEARRDAIQVTGAAGGAALGSLAGPAGAAAGAAGGFFGAGMIAPQGSDPGATVTSLPTGLTGETDMSWTIILIGLGVALYMGAREVLALKARDKEQQKQIDELWDQIQKKADKP